MQMHQRIALIIWAIVVWYLAVVFGDAIYHWTAMNIARGGDSKNAAETIVVLFSLFLIVGVGVYAAYNYEKSREKVSATILLVGGFIFGELTAPGGYPWQWYNKLTLLPVLTATPMIFIIVDLGKELLDRRRAGKGNVTQLHKDRA